MGLGRITAMMIFLLAGLSAFAQEGCYMVFFADKAGVSHEIDAPLTFLSERAITRRLKAGAGISEYDLPVSPQYTSAVKSTGVQVIYTTRWLNGVLVRGDAELIAGVSDLPFVTSVEFVGPVPEAMQTGRRSFSVRTREKRLSGDTESQLKMIGVDYMHREGYTGEGVIIAVLDSGFPGVDATSAFGHLTSQGRLQEDVSFNYVANTANVYQLDDHGTEVLSVIAANIPDAYTGAAHNATFQLYVTEDVRTEFRIEEYNWLFAAERADSAGADIIHSSLGYYDFDDAAMNYSKSDMDGKTTVVSRAARMAVERGIVVVTSAGNEGILPHWRIITAPADVDGVIAVGAVNALGQKVGSSSFGPSADNRIKPDVAALGQGVKVVRASGQVGVSSGTSFSAPLVTGLVAGMLQRYPELTPADVVAVLAQTSSQAHSPDNQLGYGIPNFQAIERYLSDISQVRGGFEVFPNPVETDTLVIRSNDPESTGSCVVEILSAQGKLLVAETALFGGQQRTYYANIAGIPAGVYFIRVVHGNSRHTFRIVRL